MALAEDTFWMRSFGRKKSGAFVGFSGPLLGFKGAFLELLFDFFTRKNNLRILILGAVY